MLKRLGGIIGCKDKEFCPYRLCSCLNVLITFPPDFVDAQKVDAFRWSFQNYTGPNPDIPVVRLHGAHVEWGHLP